MLFTDTNLPLAVRIKRVSFALTFFAILAMVAVLMVIMLRSVPDSQRKAHQGTVGVLAQTMSADINKQLRDIDELSKSSLVWTSLSDSAGRDAYLKPFLEARSATPGRQRLALMDYRGRPVLGALPDALTMERVMPVVSQSIDARVPRLEVFQTADKVLLLAVYPVLYPYTQDAVGVLVSAIDVSTLLSRGAAGLNEELRVNLLHGAQVLQGPPLLPGGERYFPVKVSIDTEQAIGGGALELQLYALENPWVAPVLRRLAMALFMVLVFGVLIWRVAGVLAGRITGRLGLLAAECEAISRGQGETVTDDKAQDEIGVLARTLRQTLLAYEDVKSQLEQRVIERTAQLNLSEERLSNAIDGIEDPFVIFDPHDRLVYANQGFEQMCLGSGGLLQRGSRYEDAMRLWRRRVKPTETDQATRDWLAKRLEDHRHGCVLVHETEDGRWVRDVERRTVDGYTVGFLVDITELVQAQRQAEAASVAKSRFLATMSHELRTPLNGVLGMAELLKESDISESERREFIETIIRSGQTLLSLLNDILDLSRIEAEKMSLELQPGAPARLVDEAVSLFKDAAKQKHLALTGQWLGDSPQRYLLDSRRLTQMLNNLLSNAIKFTDQGHVTVLGREVERDGQQAVLEFSVTDSGIGIAPELKDRLFKPFTQLDSSDSRRYGGSGLGLSIVHRLAELHGGTTGLESSPGKGARFWFRIRAACVDCAAEPDTELPALAETPVGDDKQPEVRGRILVVEDHAPNRFLIKTILSKLGLTVEMVENGQEAVDFFKSGQTVDLVLMDLQMPVMDGFQAAAQIRQLEQDKGLPRLPIIALTANAFDAARQQAIEVGMDDFLTKPVVLKELRGRLERWLGDEVPGA